MKLISLATAVGTIVLFFTACNTTQPEQTAANNPYADNRALTEPVPSDQDYWAKENFDLQRVGPLLERADSPEKFEYLLNSENGINNLDFNGDGYTDYISVAEFDDREDNGRGLSLFSRFGPDTIQEIATIFFNRDDRNSRGARILLAGNEQIYGDNNYYETNWLDRSLGIANWLFNDRQEVYRSPYYYENYPASYDLYRVVETPVYRTRIEQTYPTPVFVVTTNPAIAQFKIKSPYHGRSMNSIYYKLAKPTKEQKEFKAKNPNRPEFVPVKGDRRRNDLSKPGEQPMINPKIEKEKAKPSDAGKGEKHDGNPGKPQKPGKGKGKNN